MAFLTVIVGPAKSMKRNEVFLREEIARKHGRRTVIVAHSSKQQPKSYEDDSREVLRVQELCHVDLRAYDMVFVLHGELFFHLIADVQHLLCQGKVVCVSGRNSMANILRPHQGIAYLAGIAEEVYPLRGICCYCCTPASFTKKFPNNLYEPVCRDCLQQPLRPVLEY